MYRDPYCMGFYILAIENDSKQNIINAVFVLVTFLLLLEQNV